MKILKSNNFDARISVFQEEGESFVRMVITFPHKWRYNVIFRGGGSLHDEGEHFEIDDGDETVCEFCLVPENENEKKLLSAERYSYQNKNQWLWIFIPIPYDLPINFGKQIWGVDNFH